MTISKKTLQDMTDSELEKLSDMIYEVKCKRDSDSYTQDIDEINILRKNFSKRLKAITKSFVENVPMQIDLFLPDNFETFEIVIDFKDNKTGYQLLSKSNIFKERVKNLKEIIKEMKAFIKKNKMQIDINDAFYHL